MTPRAPFRTTCLPIVPTQARVSTTRPAIHLTTHPNVPTHARIVITRAQVVPTSPAVVPTRTHVVPTRARVTSRISFVTPKRPLIETGQPHRLPISDTRISKSGPQRPAQSVQRRRLAFHRQRTLPDAQHLPARLPQPPAHPRIPRLVQPGKRPSELGKRRTGAEMALLSPAGPMLPLGAIARQRERRRGITGRR